MSLAVFYDPIKCSLLSDGFLHRLEKQSKNQIPKVLSSLVSKYIHMEIMAGRPGTNIREFIFDNNHPQCI